MDIFSDTKLCIKYLRFQDLPPNLPISPLVLGYSISKCVLKMMSIKMQIQEGSWAILRQRTQGTDEKTHLQQSCMCTGSLLWYPGLDLRRPLVPVDSAFFSPTSLVLTFILPRPSVPNSHPFEQTKHWILQLTKVPSPFSDLKCKNWC